MVNIWKRLAASAKGFAAESAHDFRAEYAKALAPQVAATAARTAFLAKRLALASPDERTIAALAAPYRETFLGELAAAREPGREPALLMCMGLHEEEKASWVKLLHRDFGVGDPNDVETVLTLMVEGARGGTADEVAIAVVRACHLAAGAVGVDLIEAPQAVAWARPAVASALDTFASWTQLGEAFLLGERSAPGSNPIGRKVLASTVARLQNDPASPWRTLPWPATQAG